MCGYYTKYIDYNKKLYPLFDLELLENFDLDEEHLANIKLINPQIFIHIGKINKQINVKIDEKFRNSFIVKYNDEENDTFHKYEYIADNCSI